MEGLIFPKRGEKFEVNGRIYKEATSLSTERFEIMERFDKQFAFGTDFVSFFQMLQNGLELSNQNRTGDIAILLYNAMQAMSNIEQGNVYAFDLCTLFLNYEGEDVRTWSKELADMKRKDWSDAGIDAMYFFQLAASFVPGYLQALKGLLADSSSLQMKAAQ